MQFKSKVIDVNDAWEWLELAYAKGWTDGLPVFPPMRDRVEAMIQYVGRGPEESLGPVPPQNGEATVEKVAIQCVMAGCRPEYFPVVLAALDALLDERFNLFGVETTTGPHEPLTIVCGPVVNDLRFNCGDAVFGAGRPNATIGRALRLVLWNIGGAYPGVNAKSPLSHPGRYTFCIAENMDENPWPPMHRDFGLTSESGVVVFGCESPHGLASSGDASHTLTIWADAMSRMGSNNIKYSNGGQALLVMGPRVAQKFTAEGWTKDDIRRYLFDNARRRIGDLKKAYGMTPEAKHPGWPQWVDQQNSDALVPIVADPRDLHLAVAGGTAAHWFTAWCPGWGLMGGLAVARSIESGKKTL